MKALTKSKKELLEELGEGVEENMDPGLVRAFDKADEDVDPKLINADSVKMVEDKFRVSGDGVFYTLQGEGETMGRPCVFLRLHVCNLKCVWCFPRGTSVLTPSGEKDISLLEVGEEVISFDSKRGVSTISVVEKKMQHKTNDLVEVKPKFKGESFIVTKEHKFHIDKRKSSTGNRSREEAQNLTGKVCKFSYGYLKKMDLLERYLRGYVQGAYVGDGYSNAVDKMQFQVIDIDFAEAIQQAVNYLGADCNITDCSRKTDSGNLVYRVSCSKQNVVRTILEPLKSKEDWRGFIAGFYDAEGSLGKNLISFSQKDKKILNRIKHLLLREGIESSKIIRGHRGYYFQVTGKTNLTKFFTIMPVQITRKIYGSKRAILLDEPIESVKEVNREMEVFNIQTTKGNYFANNLLVDNCDAWYTWNPKTPEFWTESNLWTIEETKAKIEEQWNKGCENKKLNPRVVITGGEPMLHKDRIDKLMRLMPDWYFEIETNGTIMPTEYMIQEASQTWVGSSYGPDFLLNESRLRFNCSPKLNNSGNLIQARKKPDVIKQLYKLNTLFKFVVMSNEDLDEIEKEWVEEMEIPIQMVSLMPQGVTSKEVQKNMQHVAEYAKKKGFRLLGRLQNDIWGARRRV